MYTLEEINRIREEVSLGLVHHGSYPDIVFPGINDWSAFLELGPRAEAVITNQTHFGSDGPMNDLEMGGFYIGEIAERDGDIYGVAHDVIPLQVPGKRSSITIPQSEYTRVETEMTLWNKRNGTNFVDIGWYHTHPGNRLWLSDGDKSNHIRRYGAEPRFMTVVCPKNSTLQSFVKSECRECDTISNLARG